MSPKACALFFALPLSAVPASAAGGPVTILYPTELWPGAATVIRILRQKTRSFLDAGRDAPAGHLEQIVLTLF